MGETGVLFSGSQLCTFNDDYRSQLLADCCTAQCVLSRIKPLLPSSRMKTAGRDRPPLRAAAGHAAGLPDNVTLLRPETTRSRGCHVQLGCLCFLLRPSWRRAPAQAEARHEQRALQRAFAERSEVPSAPLRKETESCTGSLPGSTTAPGGFFCHSLLLLLSFPLSFPPKFPSLTTSQPVGWDDLT